MSKIPKVSGEEILKISVAWINGHRDRVVVEHTPCGCENSTIVVSGRSANDLMRTIARFLGYELELSDNSFNFKFEEHPDA